MERLRRYLEESGIKQVDFARVMDVSQATVSDWITGKTSPSIGRLRDLSRRTGISIDELLAEPRRTPKRDRALHP
jgi:transcriptional regulator with XRE-family HTH domain